MEFIDNINSFLGDDLKQILRPRAKLNIAASGFSMYAYEVLKRVVFRDAGFKSDSVKIDVEQIFRLLSPSADVKCI